MSLDLQSQIAYRVVHRAECVLIYGAVPAEDLVALTKARAGKDNVFAADLARLGGANMAFGPVEAVDALRNKLAADRLFAVQAAYPLLPNTAHQWLAFGDQGLSSCAMFYRFTEINPDGTLDIDTLAAHPHDPADFIRCRQLLDGVPEFADRIAEMRDVSPIWARFVNSWAELCATLDAEIPDWRDRKSAKRSATRTFERIQQIISSNSAAASEPRAAHV